MRDRNKDDILQQVKSYKKLSFSKLSSEEYEVKPYLSEMNVHKARTFFAIRSSMLPTVQMNYKHKPEYMANQ